MTVCPNKFVTKGPRRDNRVTRSASSRVWSVRAELQADARDGLDESRVRAVVTELATKPMDGHTDGVAGWRVVVAPDVLRERGRRNDRVDVAHEVLEQPELGAGQVERLIVQLKAVLVDVQAQRPHFEDRRERRARAIGRGAPGVGADPGEELAMAERLHDVIVRAEVERAHLVVLAIATRQDDDRGLLVPLPQLPEQLEAVPRRHVQIDDREGGVLFLEELDGAFWLIRAQWDMARLFDEEGEQLDQLAVVIDHEDLAARVAAILDGARLDRFCCHVTPTPRVSPKPRKNTGLCAGSERLTATAGRRGGGRARGRGVVRA